MTKRVLFLGLVCLLAACAPKTNRPWVDPRLAANEAEVQREMAVREFSERRARLNAVATRVLLANSGLCEKNARPVSGLHVMQLDAVDKEWRDAYAKVYGLDQRLRVVDVPPGSPVESAGLKRNDVVVALAGAAVVEDADGLKKFQADVEQAAAAGPYVLTVEREGRRLDLRVTPVPACAFPVEYLQNETVNAYADGTKIVVTQGMVRFCEKDEELALVIGHELAHNNMGHITAQRGNHLAGSLVDVVFAVLLGVNTGGTFGNAAQMAYSQDFESEADYVGLYYVARADYGITDAANFWRRMAAAHPQSIGAGTTHPSSPMRYVAIEATRDEIVKKRGQGAPLVPEMQPEAQSGAAGGGSGAPERLESVR